LRRAEIVLVCARTLPVSTLSTVSIPHHAPPVVAALTVARGAACAGCAFSAAAISVLASISVATRAP
jgi:hypothetical protein